MKACYSPKGKFLLDIWFIKDKGIYHVFYLQVKKTKDPKERDNSKISIGHACSKDLKKWKELPTALKPGRKGEWDDRALWTGSVIKKDKKYYMFYTGRNSKKSVKWIQKLGLAVSDDLINWRKFKSNPILVIDKRYYEMRNNANKVVWHDDGVKHIGKVGAWRDPYVFLDPKSKKYYMTISARKKGKKREYNACIALAESEDLINWKVLPPILAPGRYDEMETSQVVYHEGKYYLFFGVASEGTYEPKWERNAGTHTGLHCYYSKSLFRRYKPVNKHGVVVEDAEQIYGIRLLYIKGNEYAALGWLNEDKKGRFIGKMSPPFKLFIKGSKIIKPNGF